MPANDEHRKPSPNGGIVADMRRGRDFAAETVMAGSAAIHVVEGWHPTVPGRRMSAHTSREAALDRAVQILDELLAGPACRGLALGPATHGNWKEISEALREHFGADAVGVEVSEIRLEA